jgi:hypothetical protein
VRIKPNLMWRRKAKPGVADGVARRADEAAQLAKIPGQHRLTDPRTNPAVREHADRLLNKEHEKTLTAAFTRKMRRHRVEERRASYAERALEAIQAAQESRSPAKSVLFLHARRKLYTRTSLVTSVGLAGGSAMGLEHLAEAHNIPTGTGYIVEVGLTFLATIAIQARADLSQHRAIPEDATKHEEQQKQDWRDSALWALMVLPLAASMAANIHGHNVLGALCAAGAAAFSLFSYIVSDLFAAAAKIQSKKVAHEDERELRDIASGDDLLAEPQRVPQTFFDGGAINLKPLAFDPRRVVLQSEPTRELAGGSETRDPDQVRANTGNRSDIGSGPQWRHQVPDPNTNRSQTHQPDRSADQVPDPNRTQTTDLPDPQVSDPKAEKVSDRVPNKPKTRKTQTGPKKPTRSKPKAKPLDRIDEATAADKAYLAEHGRHIPAEKLARALSIGKPAALELVKQIRGGHLEIAK